MHEYNITDAASCAAAIQRLNTELYSLRSKREETHDLTVELNARIDSYEKWKKYRKHHQAWEKLEDMKEEVRRLEVVKRELIQENKRTKPDRYGR